MHNIASSLFLLLVFANILLDLDQAWHGQLDSSNKGIDHVHVWHSFDQLLLPGWYVSLPRQQLHSLQQLHGLLLATALLEARRASPSALHRKQRDL